MSLHGTTSFGAFVDLDDVKQWLGVTSTSNDNNLQLLLEGACDMVQRYCNRPIAATRFERAVDGGSGLQAAYIMLPYYPVLEVIEVIEYQGSNPVELFEVQPSTGGDGFRVYYPTGRLNRVIGGVYQRPWMPSELGVFVTWVAGFDPLPASLRLATLDLIKYWWVQSQAFGDTGSSSPYSDETGAPSGLFPGLPNRIKTMLDPFVAVAMG